jgi:hypothetical protein
LALVAPHRTARTCHFASHPSGVFTFKPYLRGALSAQYASSATSSTEPYLQFHRTILAAPQNRTCSSTEPNLQLRRPAESHL